MIELRWITGLPGTGRGITMGSGPQVYEMILQYREGGYDVVRRDTGEKLWCGSDWQDVPTPYMQMQQFAASRGITASSPEPDKS